MRFQRYSDYSHQSDLLCTKSNSSFLFFLQPFDHQHVLAKVHYADKVSCVQRQGIIDNYRRLELPQFYQVQKAR